MHDTDISSTTLTHSYILLSQADLSADDLLWVLYIMYSYRASNYLRSVTTWDELPRALAHAQRCVAKACELKPKLPYGFEVAVNVFQASRAPESMYMYAEKVGKSPGDPQGVPA